MLPRNCSKVITFGFCLILCVQSVIVTVKAADIQSCYYCEEEECEDPIISNCTQNINNNGGCFIRFDSARNVVEMGCLTQFSDQDKIKEHIMNKTLYVCEGENCNGYENLPSSSQCTECSSLNEEACATKPATITKQPLCNNIPYGQCYQRVKGSVTYRGCLNDLKGEEFYQCLTGADKNCLICEGKNCNEEIIPSDRKRCHRCDSEADSNCESNPSALSVCPSYSEADLCVATFENGVTKRGCETDFTCDLNTKNCQRCRSDGCNSYNIKRRFDDIYGIFQDLPLNCNTCKGDDCDPGKNRFPNKCEGDPYQDCMTVFDSKGKVIQRGCEFKVLAEQQKHCSSEPNLCFKCKANGCNEMTNASVYQECLHCDAATNPDCLFNSSAITTTRKCTLGCVSSLYSRKTSKKVKDFVRTCFEDIEPDNRDSCVKENNCVKCSGNKCNTDVLPAKDRLSCLHCNGVDCDLPVSKQCIGYNPDDMCYIYFDNTTLSAVRMGCRSDVSDEQLRKEIKQYFVCDGDNCNDYGNLPAPLFCTSCDSENDVNCVTQISQVSERARCSQYPYTQCFTRIRDDGYTQRGCLSSLPTEDFISCNDGDPSSLCAICNKDQCNRGIFPYSRRKCYRCNSTTDSKCEAAPTASNEVCPLYKKDDACITQWVNGTTIRGCASEITCDGLGNKNCRKCADSFCNYVNLANEDIGDLGLFTSLPLSCRQCNGTAQCGSNQTSFEVCRDNIQQSCTTIFNEGGEVVARGCSDRLESTCSVEGNKCFDCKSNSCNSAESLTDYIDCLHCDAKYNEDCVLNPNAITRTRKCYKSCMTALYPRTADNNTAFELVRGCLDDKDLEDRNKCDASKDPTCVSCEQRKCNTNLLGSRKSCYQCRGAECDSPTIKTCRAVANNDQCFVEYGENRTVVSLGCRSNYDPAEVDALLKQKRLWLCDKDNCNSIGNIPKPNTCVLCNSKTDKNCAIDSGRVQAVTTCDTFPYTQCYSRILEDGHTERGCLSNLEDEEFLNCFSNKNSTKCSACAENKCNQEIFPADRRSCERCSSKDDTKCENSPGFASICPIYSAEEYCVTEFVNGHTNRGCSSELQCDDSNKQHCRSCYNADDCNTVNLAATYVGEPGKWQELPLSCHNCTGPECEIGFLQKCEGNNLQTCMTVFGAEGTVVQRGCSGSITGSFSNYCDQNPDKCFACKSNACNNAEKLSDYIDCYFCESSESSGCATTFNASNFGTRKCHKSCMVTLYPLSSANDSSYELSRTCLDDLEADDRDKCAKGNKQYCKTCDSPRCNTMDAVNERFECYQCLDDDCEDMAPQQCTSYHPNEQCYVLYNNESSIIKMGCRSDLEASAVVELVKQKQLRLCKENKCNAPENLPSVKRCSVCNSAVNPNCATNPNLVNNITRCATLPYTECYTLITPDGHTDRGCVGALPEDDFYGCVMGTDGLCETCVGDQCNEIDVYPKNRRRCYHCDSDSDPNCTSVPSNNKVCEKYTHDDYCVTSYRNGVTSRGCRSSVECDPVSCRGCAGDNCNTVNMKTVVENGYPGRWQDTPISCYTCKGEEECAGKGDLRACQGDPLQNCMTIFDSMSGKVIQRGCSSLVEKDNREYCEQSPDKCMRCNSNGCNEATSLQQYVECLYCDTEANGKCVTNPTGSSMTRQCYKFCVTALYSRFNETNTSYGLSRSCYDDMDYDDRELCAAGNKTQCKVCNSPKCNIDDMPAERLSCYVWEKQGGEEPKVEKCSTYRPDDKCYTRFDERNQVVSLGCRSQFSNAAADDLMKLKQLLICNGVSCNSLENIPKAQTCVVCNSRTNIKCAVDVSNVNSKTECGLLPYTECYSRILAEGTTERGCLSNLEDDEFLGCLNGTSTSCEWCRGDECNNKTYPINRRSCHVCDSSSDPNCEASPNNLSICSIYDSNDTCVTAFRNNVTHRGCSSSLACDVSNPLACVKCSGDGCNTINLAKKQDYNFGMWQDLPLTCLSCSGNDCNAEETTKSVVCQVNNNQDCMTVFSDSGKVIARGCSDSVASEFCTDDDVNCYSCKSNKCNKATSKSAFEECVYCNSYNNRDCVWNPLSDAHKTRKCDGGCMTALYPSDSSNSTTFELIRTCLNDKELPAQNNCTQGKDKNCSACSGNRCNTNQIPENRLSCFACQGESCEMPEKKLCPLYRDNDQCFIRFDDTNSISDMGCISSFRNQDLESIIKTKRVQVCSGANCNSLDQISAPQICAVCSSADNLTCAVNPSAITTSGSCNTLPFTSCYTKITGDGKTERGCLSNLQEDEFAACVLGNDDKCNICKGRGCNREIFPRDRLQCYTCEASEEDKSCESFPTTKNACPVLSEDESCVTALRGNVTVRGCKSLTYCDSNDSSTCRSCFGSECNAIDLLNKKDDGYHGVWQELPLKCYTCEGDHCLNSLGASIACSSRNIKQDCMTVFDEQGRVERRGCSDQVEDYKDLYCRLNPERCFKCKSNECNIAWSMKEYVNCLFCDSANETRCAENPGYSDLKTRKCYKNCMVAMKAEQTIRSCLDDKEMWAQLQCQSNSTNYCSACSGDSCNSFSLQKGPLKCHVCTNPSCTDSKSEYCEKQESKDSCFAKFENGLVSLLGCMSSQNPNDTAEWTAQNKLYKCDTDDCNAPTNLLKSICVTCDSSKDPYCAQYPSQVSTTETCMIPGEKCFAQIDGQGHTIRGCFSKLNHTEQNCEIDGICTSCQGDKCNDQIYPANRRECHICDSTTDTNCRKNPSSLKVCPIYDANDSCVSSLDYSGFFKRGCASQVQCSVNADAYCDQCNTNGCNTVELTGSASVASSSVFLMLLVAFISLFVVKY